jgi:hypothetical protein
MEKLCRLCHDSGDCPVLLLLLAAHLQAASDFEIHPLLFRLPLITDTLFQSVLDPQ